MAPKKKRPQGTPSSVSSETLSSKGGKQVSNAEERRARRAEAVATMKAEQARRQMRSRLLAAGGIVVGVAIIVVAVIAVGLGHKQEKGATTTTASEPVIQGVTSVPAATFDTVGLGDLKTLPTPIEADPLTADGKPRILYVGAEYCPFCAAERWSVAAALSRFGTFTGLGQTESAPKPEVYPNTPTLSFHGAKYTSQYLSFSGYEIQDTNHQTLDTLPKDDEALLSKYDSPPYVQGQGGSIPFIDLFGTHIVSGASYNPDLFAGKTHEQVAQAMQDPTSAIAKSVDAAANAFSAIICQATNGQPSNVCDSAGVKAAAAKLPAS